MSRKGTYQYRVLNGNKNNFNISNSFNNNFATDTRSEVLSWISPLEPRKRHHDVRNRRFSGIGDWLRDTTDFRKWRNDHDEPFEATLFCYGAPGAGKTFMSSLIIDTLCDETLGQNIGVACLYCDFLNQREQDTTSLVGGLLKQLVVGLEETPDAVDRAFQDAKRSGGGRSPLLPQMLNLFSIVLSSFHRAFICVDALDELLPEHRIRLLRALRQITQNSPNVRFFLTGRPHVQEEIERYLAKSPYIIAIQPSQEDIGNYLIMRLDDDPYPSAMDDDLKLEIINNLPQSLSEIFLLVALHTDAVLGEFTISERREKLHQKAKNLGDAYGATLDRIRRQKGNISSLAMAALMWISLAERPLRVNELCHALSVKAGALPSANIDPGRIPPVDILLGSCQGLITVDNETSTIRLIHSTLKEYLHAYDTPVMFENPHVSIAGVCLQYLCFPAITGLSSTLAKAPRELPFLEYASRHWGDHVKKQFSSSLQPLALELLAQYPNHVSAKLFLCYQDTLDCWRHESWGRVSSERFSGLHFAASLGITELTIALLEMGVCDANQQDSMGRTPLLWAAASGHEDVVKLLLTQKGVNADLADTNSGQTPISWAARNGHESVVKLFLTGGDVDPDLPSHFISQQTPLSWASGNGHDRVVRLLLDRGGVDPDPKDTSGQTPLSHAAENGHGKVVQILINREDVMKDSLDGDSRTPLSLAAGNGHEGVVEILLNQPVVGTNLIDRHGRTALSWAAKAGHKSVVKLLVNRAETNPDIPDNLGKRPLSLAAENGHEATVKILLSHSQVNPDAADKYGRTPLSYASMGDHLEAMRLLLGRQDVNINSQDRDGQTPLFCAAKNGYAAAVKFLLDRSDVNPNLRDNIFDETPLISAARPLKSYARDEYEAVVKLLLDREDLDVNFVNKSGWTALSAARASQLSAEVVELIERRGAAGDA